MGYVANVQLSPYVAQERGYLQDAGSGCNLRLPLGDGRHPACRCCEIPFTVASGDQVIQARSKGLPVVAVAGWYHKTFRRRATAPRARRLSDRKTCGTCELASLRPWRLVHRVAGASTRVAGLTEADIDLQAIGYTQLAMLTSGTVDAVVVYANNEPVVLAQQGIPYNAIYASDYVDLVSAVIVSSDNYVETHPEETQRFVAAFLKGVDDVIRDPDAAFAICERVVEGLGDNAGVQREVLNASIELWKAPQLGIMSADAWDRAQDVMLSAGLIETVSPIENLFTNAFVPHD